MRKLQLITSVLVSALITFTGTGNSTLAEEPQITISEQTETEEDNKPRMKSLIGLFGFQILKAAPREVIEEPTEAEEYPVISSVDLDLELQQYIWQRSTEAELSPYLVFAVIWRESTFRADVMGDSGKAYGLMQIHPQWHQERMDKLGCTDLLNPYENVAVGIDYLAELAGEGKGQTWVLHAYNGGPDYADELMAAGKVSQYTLDVLDKINQLSEEGE